MLVCWYAGMSFLLLFYVILNSMVVVCGMLIADSNK